MPEGIPPLNSAEFEIMSAIDAGMSRGIRIQPSPARSFLKRWKLIESHAPNPPGARAIGGRGACWRMTVRGRDAFERAKVVRALTGKGNVVLP